MQSETLVPDQIYRASEARKYFGYKATQLDQKIKTGEIPTPISLSDTGRARGWLGRQIIKWQSEREAASDPDRKARHAAPSIKNACRSGCVE